MGRRLIFIDDKPGYGGVSTCLICLRNELCKIGRCNRTKEAICAVISLKG